jgi:acyl transferase domain-containing protein
MDLPISHGFHSRHMDAAATPVRDILGALKFQAPQIPLISAASGPVSTPNAAHLWEAIRGVVDFRSTIAKLETAGGGHYVDVGPSGTMATLVKHNLGPASASSFLAILSPFGRSREHLAKALQATAS